MQTNAAERHGIKVFKMNTNNDPMVPVIDEKATITPRTEGSLE